MMQSINLIPMRRQQARRRRVWRRRWCVTCIVYALAVGGAIGGVAATSGREGRTGASIVKVRADAKQTQGRIESTRAALTEAQMQLEANREVAGLPDWSILLTMLAQDLGDEVFLTDCRIADRAPVQFVARNQTKAASPAVGNGAVAVGGRAVRAAA